VALARLVVSSMALARRELADDRIDDLKLAVSEACTNAIEAHGAIDVQERVTVRCEESDDRLEVLVEDRGAGFDPTSLPEHPPVTDPDRLNFERGLGIPLIRSLVDEVDFETGPSGTAVRLTIYCGPSERV
jgi:serine/threonine-protein kinase RsbW